MSSTIQPGKILIIDDNETLLEVLEIALGRDQHKVFTANLPSKGLKILDDEDIDIVLQDIRMPEMDGVQLLSKIKEKKPNQVIFLMTAYSTWDVAVNAMRKGAFGYFEKKSPFDTGELRAKINITLQKIYREKSRATSFYAASQIIGYSSQMLSIQKLLELVAPTESPVLIYGESGTGKELIAKSLHFSSLRNNNSFITFNCGEFTNTLIESELFGHTKGSFTGAIDNKKGLIEMAEGGTLFMDELGEMPLDMQVKLLRVLENRELRSVGASKVKKIDVRFIFATNKNIEDMVSKGTFREDLYYRINVVNIRLPPLKERIDDIPLLVGSFLNKFANLNTVKTIDEDTMNAIKLFPWPGNIRELQNKIQRATILTDKKNITLLDIFSKEEIKEFNLLEGALKKMPEIKTSFIEVEKVFPQPIPIPVKINDFPIQSPIFSEKTHSDAPKILHGPIDLEKEVEKMELEYIKSALIKASGNLAGAAKMLNLTIRAIRYKIKKYKIRYSEFPDKDPR